MEPDEGFIRLGIKRKSRETATNMCPFDTLDRHARDFRDGAIMSGASTTISQIYPFTSISSCAWLSIRSTASLTRVCGRSLLKLIALTHLFLMWAGIVAASGGSLSGVYALADQDAKLSSAILGNPNVDGLALRYSWKQLEPREGVFNWSPIDAQIAAAQAHHKKVSLGVTAGIRTPAWVYASEASYFTFVWDKPWGAAMCSTQRIPIPWDPIYLAKWDTFVRALGARYAHTSVVVYVKITGVNAATQEAILPHSRSTTISGLGVTCVSGDDIGKWQAVGYSRGRIVQAWKHMADTFAESFPDTKLGLMIGPAGFPPIDDEGKIIPNRGADRELALHLIAEGSKSYGRRFVVQNNGLSAVRSWPELDSLSRVTIVGWQMAWSATNDARCKMNGGVVPCDPQDVLRSAISRGIESNAAFLEIYTLDILNPALQDIIAHARGHLSSS
jgi:hypothetical protein